MSKRRSHSSIDNLPEPLRDTLTRMVIDGLWPDDCPGDHEGKPTYDNMVEYCVLQGRSVSSSAMGRWAKGLRVIEKMTTAGLIVRKTMGNMTGEDAPKTQKAAAEYMGAIILDFMVSREDYTSKQIKEVSQAIRDCAQVSINADKYIRQAIAEKVAKAAKSTKAKLNKAGVDRKLIQEIIDEHLGVIK